MFWVSSGSLILIFLSIRAFLNNRRRWTTQKSFKNRFYYWFLQGATLLLIIAGVLFFMLAVVSHFQGYEIHFSSDHSYHMHIENGDSLNNNP